MSITLTADALTQLGKDVVKIYLTAEIIKYLFDASNRVTHDISEHVLKYGSFENMSTLKGKDWKIPNLTITLLDAQENDGGVAGGYYNKFNGSSIWYSPEQLPKDCHLRVRAYIVLSNGDPELMFEYIGSIDDAVPDYSENTHKVEIITTMIHDSRLRKEVDKSEGDPVEYI